MLDLLGTGVNAVGVVLEELRNVLKYAYKEISFS